MASWWQSWFGGKQPNESELEAEMQRLREKTPVPTLWMFGKTGSGKSSIVRYLTGAESATIGAGFRPETKTSKRYDFPDSSDPLLRFIDTRGLGEAHYQPEEDIQRFSRKSELMMVTVRVTDQALDQILEPLRRIRKDAPQRPILLVLSCLHEALGQLDISAGADPFQAPASVNTAAAEPTAEEPNRAETTLAELPAIPSQLQILIDQKVAQFEGLHDVVVPIDLTQPEDGFADPNYGGQRLKQTILEYLPHAYRQSLLTLNEPDARPLSSRQKRVRWHVLASSALAATAGAVPLPWVDIPAVLAIQGYLAVRISKIHHQEISAADWTVISSVAGSRIALRMAIREALKFIPLVGMAVGAATSFAVTYALGMTWDWYFAYKREGEVPSADKLRKVFAEQLKRGHELWRAT